MTQYRVQPFIHIGNARTHHEYSESHSFRGPFFFMVDSQGGRGVYNIVVITIIIHLCDIKLDAVPNSYGYGRTSHAGNRHNETDGHVVRGSNILLEKKRTASMVYNNRRRSRRVICFILNACLLIE